MVQTLSSDTLTPVSWSDFLADFRWAQGEHLTVLGPTGNGKTTLILQLLPLQPFVVFLGTKPRDDTLTKLIGQGYRRVKRWEDRSPVDHRILLWPDSRKLTAPLVQKQVFTSALAAIFEQGGWCVVFDEVLEFVEDLRMPNTVKRFLNQGRSNHISVVAGSQRPRAIPVVAYSAARHLFLYRTTDREDVKRLADISGNVNKREIEGALQTLPSMHHFLYVNTRTGAMQVSRVELPEGG